MYAKQGYICYLRNPELHTNKAHSHAGFGGTPEEARKNAFYWNNQRPWCVVVRRVVAPKWAIEEAEQAAFEARSRTSESND